MRRVSVLTYRRTLWMPFADHQELRVIKAHRVYKVSEAIRVKWVCRDARDFQEMRDHRALRDR